MNAVANLTNVLRMKREHCAYAINLHNNLHNTHCGYFSLSYICQLLSNEFIFLQICTYCHYSSNVNTNASESLQTSYDHYKCLANNKNGLRLVTNMLRMVTYMLRICFRCKLCKSSIRYHCFPWPIILFSWILARNSNFLQFSHSQGKLLLFDAYETCYS